MILFNHFMEKFAAEIDKDTIDGEEFDVSIYVDGLEDELYVRLHMPTGEIKKSIGFSEEQIDRFKQKILPMHKYILLLIDYWSMPDAFHESYQLGLRLRMIDPNLRLIGSFISPFDRAALDVGRWYFIHCNLHDMYYDETELYQYTGYEFVTADGRVLSYSHVLDMELDEYAHVCISRVVDDPDSDRLSELLTNYRVIKIDASELRAMLDNVRIRRELTLESIQYRDNVCRVKLICEPAFDDCSYIYLAGEIADASEPERIKFFLPFIETNKMCAISSPIDADRFGKYLKDSQSKVQDFLSNFAGFDRGIKIIV